MNMSNTPLTDSVFHVAGNIIIWAIIGAFLGAILGAVHGGGIIDYASTGFSAGSIAGFIYFAIRMMK